MNSSLSFLECEAPEKRVFEWLKQCSAAPKDVEHCNVDSMGAENETDGSESITCVYLRKKHDMFNKLHSSRRQNDSFSMTRNEHSKAKRQKSSDADSGCLTSSTAWRVYSPEENQQIVKYIVENDAFPFLKGTLLWQKMEKEKICYRSWQSMKTQFIKKIYPKLGEYSMEHEDKEKFMEYMKPSPQKKKKIHMEPGQRGWRKNAKYYTIEEDLTILKYILRRRRHLEVHGNSMWQAMEDRQILPDRTWQSMRSRYLNVIRHSLDEYKLTDSSIETLINSKKNGLSSKEKLNTDVSQPPSLCINIPNKKAANQDIRKYAIRTGAQLASKFKLYGKKTERVRKPETVQHTNCSSQHHESPDTETPTLDQYERNENNNNNNNNNNVNTKQVECPVTCNISSIVPDLRKDNDASSNMSANKSDDAIKKSDMSDRSVENSESGINNKMNENKVERSITCNTSSIVPDLQKDASTNVSVAKRDNATQKSDRSDRSVANSECGNTNDVNRRKVECSTICNISDVVPDLQKDKDVSRNVAVNKSENTTEKSDRSERTIENSESGNTNVNKRKVECSTICNISGIVRDLQKDKDVSKNVAVDKSDNATQNSDRSDRSVENSERGNTKDVNRRKVECSTTSNISSIVPDLQQDNDASNVSVDKSDNATEISDRSDRSVENSGSSSNLQECTSVSAVTQNRTLEETQTFVKMHTSSRNSENCSNKYRNNIEYAMPGPVSDVHKSLGPVYEILDLGSTACTENHSSSEVNVTDIETQSETSGSGESFSSRKTLIYSDLRDSHMAIKNCIKCSSNHMLSPSSN